VPEPSPPSLGPSPLTSRQLFTRLPQPCGFFLLNPLVPDTGFASRKSKTSVELRASGRVGAQGLGGAGRSCTPLRGHSHRHLSFPPFKNPLASREPGWVSPASPPPALRWGHSLPGLSRTGTEMDDAARSTPSSPCLSSLGEKADGAGCSHGLSPLLFVCLSHSIPSPSRSWLCPVSQNRRLGPP